MRIEVDYTKGREEFCAMLKDMGVQRGAEIGVWTGDFALLMCQSIPGLHLTLVDPWLQYPGYTEGKNDQKRLDSAYDSAIGKMQPYPHRVLRMTSEAAAPLVPDGSLDFVYIDGNHAKAFVALDASLWHPKVRSGGVFSGHDYELVPKHKHVEVKQAIDPFAEANGIDTITVLMKHKAPSWYWVKP